MESVATNRTYIVGTRGSRLALAQTQLVVDALRAAHPYARFDQLEITTQGDRDTKPLSEIGGQGVFTKAIEDALLRGEIDIAVHSMKDLPPGLAEGLAIAAVPQRGDPRDALLTREGRTLAELPSGARIGTGSARRAVQLKALHADVECVDIRGNVDTRIRKLDEGQYDAIVLAKAGLERLGLGARATQVFAVEEMTPSPGQGALAVQCRSSDPGVLTIASSLDDPNTHAAVAAERAFLDAFGAGCKTPIGAFSSVEGGSLSIRFVIWDEQAARLVRGFSNESSPSGAGPAPSTSLLQRASLFGARIANTTMTQTARGENA